MKRLFSGLILITLVFAVLTAQPLADFFRQQAAVGALPVQDRGGEPTEETWLSEPEPTVSPAAASILVPASKTIILPQPSPQPSVQPSPTPRPIETEVTAALIMAKAEGGTIKVTQATTAKPAPTPRPTTVKETVSKEIVLTDEPSESRPEPPSSPRKIDPNKPMICLTYDDGPTKGVTSVILDVLKANKASATFFVIGQSVSGQKSTLKRMVAEGHEIGNHTYNHKSMIRISREEGLRQINLTQQAVKDAAGITPRIFRPPYNELNSSVLAYMPLPVIRWSVDERDWDNKTASQIASANLGKARDGAIILLHDSRYATAEASKTIIPELIRRGYQLVTVSEMFEARGITLKPGGIYRFAYP